jgi:cytochrome c oxidase cbb3-type subunit IV
MSDYFKTDWGAMTATDWVGLTLTVVIFVLMVIAYVQVFRPKHRDSLEARKHIPFEEDIEDIGDNDGGK